MFLLLKLQCSPTNRRGPDEIKERSVKYLADMANQSLDYMRYEADDGNDMTFHANGVEGLWASQSRPGSRRFESEASWGGRFRNV